MIADFRFRDSKWPQQLHDKISGFAKQNPEINGRAVRRLANDMRNELLKWIRAKQSRYATGHLMRTINTDIAADGRNIVRAAVGTPSGIMPFLEEGTQDHMVRPVYKKCLAWRLRGPELSKAKKWIGKTFSKAASSGNWSGWGHSKGHMVSGIKAWRVFHIVGLWALGKASEVYNQEIAKSKMK